MTEPTAKRVNVDPNPQSAPWFRGLVYIPGLYDDNVSVYLDSESVFSLGQVSKLTREMVSGARGDDVVRKMVREVLGEDVPEDLLRRFRKFRMDDGAYLPILQLYCNAKGENRNFATDIGQLGELARRAGCLKILDANVSTPVVNGVRNYSSAHFVAPGRNVVPGVVYYIDRLRENSDYHDRALRVAFPGMNANRPRERKLYERLDRALSWGPETQAGLHGIAYARTIGELARDFDADETNTFPNAVWTHNRTHLAAGDDDSIAVVMWEWEKDYICDEIYASNSVQGVAMLGEAERVFDENIRAARENGRPTSDDFTSIVAAIVAASNEVRAFMNPRMGAERQLPMLDPATAWFTSLYDAVGVHAEARPTSCRLDIIVAKNRDRNPTDLDSLVPPAHNSA